MQTKISELPSATELTGNEQIPAVQSGTTKKCTPGQIFDSMKSSTWAGSAFVATNASGAKIYTPYLLSEVMLKAKIYSDAGSLASSVSTTSGTTKSIGSVTFSSGFYGVVVISVTWSGNSSGYRNVSCSGAASFQKQEAPSPSGATRTQLVVPIRGSGTSLSVSVEQSSGSSINVTATYALVGFVSD